MQINPCSYSNGSDESADSSSDERSDSSSDESADSFSNVRQIPVADELYTT